MSFKLADLIRRTCCKNPSEKLQQGFVIMGMRSYLLKEQLQMKFNLKKHHFVYVCEVITKCYSHFISCSYFPLALIKLNSTHCHQIYLMELFKSKERFKEKVEKLKNCTTKNDFGVTSIFKIIIRSCKNNVEFYMTRLSFCAKGVCSFSIFFT